MHLSEQFEFDFMNDTNTKIFNPNIRAKYLENADFCPECNKENCLTAGDADFDTKSCSRTIYCNSCGFNFREVFTLTDIERIDN